nr:di-heme oxidoredictase family protein [uncultured Desulfobulbus sp.]
MRLKEVKRPARIWSLSLGTLALIAAIDWSCGTMFSSVFAHSALGTLPPGLSEDYFTGGKAGTVFATTSRALELQAPAISNDPKLQEQFDAGEAVFEALYVTDPDSPYGGLGPVYLNNSCRNCHPNYGRARRVEDFSTQFGNGYTVFVHTPDGKMVDGYMFMLQTMSVPPYTPVAKGVDITWNTYVDEYGNKYPDGTSYNQGKPTEGTLIYPTADVVDPVLPLPENYKVSLEATIGIFGTGLLDAISDEDILAEYERQKAQPGPIKGMHGKWVDEPDGRKKLGRFTWHNTRASVVNGPGGNGVWNVTNINRADRPKLFASRQWIDKQAELGLDIAPLAAHQPIEMSKEEFDSFVVWHRGLGVPAARDLHKPEVKRGRELFFVAGCTECHKPSWVTGPYPELPAFSKQKIWPYTDLLMHDMGEINHGVRPTFRTPPLWARGLMDNVVDHTDMFHDLRARDFEEAILWHFGEGLESREAFRKMPAADRAALIEFLKAI